MRWSDDFMYGRLLAKDAAYDGRFLVGVLTTGIYCRPSCTARKPRRENVRFFAGEAEAKAAGLRACLRCRPDLFLAGEDGDLMLLEPLMARVRRDPAAFRGVGDLAKACGVGASLLNRLFRDHLHRTPAAFLLEARLAAARRALAEGGRRVGEAGLEAGFESASAFFEQFRRHEGLPPEAYRLMLREGSASLRLPEDYRVEDLLAFHGRDPLSPAERAEGMRLRKAVALPSGPALLELRLEPGWAHLGMEAARLLAPGDRDRLHRAALRLLGLGQAVWPFERRTAAHPALGPLVRSRRGLRVPQSADVWEALVWAVLGQQISLPFAYQLRRALVEAFGEAVGGLLAHPGPGRLAGLEPGDLTVLRLSRAKAETLLGLARAAVSGALPLESLPEMAATRARRLLEAQKGVGPWTAHYVLMRGCAFGDCVPVGDAGLHRALQLRFGLDRRPDAREVEVLMAPFAPHRSLATFHLWTSLTGTPA